MYAGEIVRLKGKATIIQILEDGMLFSIGEVKCLQVFPPSADGAEMRAKLGDGVIRGVPMDFLTFVAGPEAHTTVTGATSYRIVLLPVNAVVSLEEVEEVVTKEKLKRDEAKRLASNEMRERSMQKQVERLSRTFKDESGRFSLNAAIVAIEGGNAMLVRTVDPSVVEVPLSRLSEEDRR